MVGDPTYCGAFTVQVVRLDGVVVATGGSSSQVRGSFNVPKGSGATLYVVISTVDVGSCTGGYYCIMWTLAVTA